MATGGVLGNGMRAAFSVGSPIDWVEVTEVIDVQFPTMVADDVNNDVHSPTNKFHRTKPGMITVGDITIITRNDFDPATSPEKATMRAKQRTGATMWWRIEAPTDDEKTKYYGIEFQGRLRDYSAQTPIADIQKINWVVKFDGDDIYEDTAVGASHFD